MPGGAAGLPAAHESMLSLVLSLALGADTIRLRPITQAPVIQNSADLAALGPPSIAVGGADAWLLGDSAAVYLVVALPDSTPEWNDRLVLTLSSGGDPGAAPGHDDFEWDFHRVADSSVIYRGREGRWQPPRDDPDWRLGRAREGGGWSVREKEMPGGWLLLIQLDPEYFATANGGRLGLAWFDAARRQWVAWPAQPRLPGALPDHPMQWGRVLTGPR